MIDTKYSILKALEKNELSVDDQKLFTESYEPLFGYEENRFIKKNWDKAIDLIDWKRREFLYSYKIFYQLGEVYFEEGDVLRALEILEDGKKKLKKWKKVNPNENEKLYATEKKDLVELSSFAQYFYILDQIKEFEDDESRLEEIIKENIKEVEKVIDYFYSLPAKFQKDILKTNKSYLTSLNTIIIMYSILVEDHQKAIDVANKNLELTKKIYGNNGIAGKEKHLGAYYSLFLAYQGVGNFNEVIFYFNQWKSTALEVFNTPEGDDEISLYANAMLEALINLGLFNEAEELVAFINKNGIFFDTSSWLGKMQRSISDYAAGRLFMMKKDYKNAVKYLGTSSRLFLDNPGSDVETLFSAQASMTLLEAYYLKGDMKNYEKHFLLLTGYKPDNFSFTSEFLPQKYFFISTGQLLAAAYTVLDYRINRGYRISKKDKKDIKALTKNMFKDFMPEVESKIDILTNYVKVSSLLPSRDKMLSKIIPEIKKEYSNSIFSSNLTPSFRADDIIQGYLNASYQTNNSKFFEKSYKIIQIVSNSISARDVKKGLQKKKYKDKQKSKLINEYQSLQIQMNVIAISDQHNINTLNQMDFSKSKLADSDRAKKITKKIKTLEDKIKKEMPSYFKLVQPSGASVKQIQKELKDNQALVEFFFFENSFYTIVIKKNDYKLFKSNKPIQEIKKSAEIVKTSLNLNEFGRLNKFNADHAYKIYSQIFAPIENYLGKTSEIIVVPNKFLKNIPLHLLPIDKSINCMQCSKINWLFNKYDFAYIPNAEFFIFSKRKKIALAKLLKNKKNNPIFLGIGDPQLTTTKKIDRKKLVKKIDNLSKIFSRGAFINDTSRIRDIYGPVEGSREELVTIKKYLEPLKSHLLLSDDANELKIKNMDLNKYKIIHFATHGELAGAIKGQNEPFLVLSPPEVGTIDNDGILTMSEIMTIENKAEIIILSACNTAAGDINQSEGFSGLAKAFLYSGSKSVLVSNWYVETFAAKELTTGMIKQIKDNPNISTANALSGSMKTFIQNNEDKSHPFFWAPFVVVGINSEINL